MVTKNKSEKILIIEDNPIAAEDFKYRLTDLGYKVCGPITRGEKVLEAVRVENPSLILMDIRLKGRMNGIEAAAEVNARHSTPIVYMTAHADPDTIERAKKTGAYGYIVKPFDDKELQSTVEIALYKYQMERQLLESRQWLETTLSSIGDGVITTDMEGKVSFINPVAESLTGWKKKEAIGKPLEAIFHIINEFSGEPCENPVDMVIKTGQIIGLANHTLLISRDGRKIPIKDSGAPIRLNRTENLGVVIVFQDDSENRKAQKEILNSNQQLKREITERRQAERKLKENVRMLHETQQLSLTGSWEYDPKTDMITWSKQTYANYAFDPREQLTRKDLYDIIHPDFRRYHEENEKLLLQQGENVFEYPIEAPDGEIRWIFATAKVFYDEKGEPDRVYGHTQNITERKRVEADLRRANENLKQTQRILEIKNRLAEIFLTIPDDDMYYEVLTVVLEAMESKFGVFGYIDENGDFIVPSMTRHTWSKCNIPDKTIVFRRSKWGCSSWPTAIREKRTNYTNEESSIVPDGHITIRRHVSLPIIIRGEVIGLFQVANKETDYTNEDIEFLEEIGNAVAPILDVRLHRDRLEKNQKAVEQSLRSSEQKYQDLFDNAPDMYITMDANDATIIDCNQTMLKTLGYSKDEVIDRPIFELYTPVSAKYAKEEAFPYFLKNGKIDDVKLQIQKKNGDIIDVNLKATAVYDENGTIIQSRTIWRDITENELLEKQLIQALKMESIGRLAGGIAHDFNNMLSIINGYANLALEKLNSSDPLYEFIEEIETAGKRSTELTRQLLTFARKEIINPKIINMNQLIDNSLKMIQRLVGEDIAIDFIPDPELWHVKVDPSQLDQILVNLAVNSRDAIAGTGKLTFETSNAEFDEAFCAIHAGFYPGNFATLSISDSGHGMDNETLENIFEPFFTTRGENKGTGLGLSTVYGIVKQNNGFIKVYSEIGTGTTFNLYFPRHEGKQQDEIDETEPVAVIGNETILFVEDEEQILKLCEKVLKSKGYNVIAASKPGEAIILCEISTGNIDLLLTDVVMPSMNGKELYERVKKIKPEIEVVYMSGYTDDIIAERGVLSKGTNFVQKPVSPKELVYTVRKILDKAKD